MTVPQERTSEPETGSPSVAAQEVSSCVVCMKPLGLSDLGLGILTSGVCDLGDLQDIRKALRNPHLRSDFPCSRHVRRGHIEALLPQLDWPQPVGPMLLIGS